MAGLKVSTRLALGFGLLVLLLIALAGAGVSRMMQMQGRLHAIVEVNEVEKAHVMSMRATVFDRMIALRNIALMTEKSDMDAEVSRVAEQATRYLRAQEALTAMFNGHDDTPETVKEHFKAANEQSQLASPIMERAIKAGQANDNQLATKILISDLRPVQKKWLDALASLAADQDELAHKAMEAADKGYQEAKFLMAVLLFIALVTAIVAGWMISRSITRQLGAEPEYASAISANIAAGDLSSEIVVRTGDHSSILAGLLKMRNDLSEIVGRVRVGTETLSTAASQIAAGNADLSARTEQQASSLEETASSMEELTTSVRQNADSARQANQLAVEASRVAAQGGEVVSQVVETMSDIDASSRKIVDIISVIDGIAFQTNILALNAAVEAARAGEQGRGFAVVATEVRSLAQKSAAAAKEIKTLIGDSVNKVDAGSKLVQQAGVTMRDVVTSVQRVTDIVTEISASTAEQSAGIEQVNQAIVQMDKVTQQNAALVEQAAAASQAMQQQTSSLVKDMSFFRIKEKLLGKSVSPALQSSASLVAPTPEQIGAIKRADLKAQAKGGASKPAKVAASDSAKRPAKASARAPRLEPVSGNAPESSRAVRPAAQTGNDTDWEEF